MDFRVFCVQSCIMYVTQTTNAESHKESGGHSKQKLPFRVQGLGFRVSLWGALSCLYRRVGPRGIGVNAKKVGNRTRDN